MTITLPVHVCSQKAFKLAPVSLFIRKQTVVKEKQFYHFVKVNFLNLFYIKAKI